MHSLMKQLKEELKGKDRSEVLMEIVKNTAAFAGVILGFLLISWIIFRPQWGYFGGGMSLRDPISGFEYYIDDTKVSVLRVIHGRGIRDGCLTLPEQFLGRQVTDVYLKGVTPQKTINKVVVPDSVTSIDRLYIKGLQEVTGGRNVRVIGMEAFADCETLTKVELGDKLKSVGRRAFEGCTALREIRLGNCIEHIEEAAFTGCTGLEKVELGYSLRIINGDVFNGCVNLKEVTKTGNLIKIYEDAFAKTPWAATEEGKKILEICTKE